MEQATVGHTDQSGQSVKNLTPG